MFVVVADSTKCDGMLYVVNAGSAENATEYVADKEDLILRKVDGEFFFFDTLERYDKYVEAIKNGEFPETRWGIWGVYAEEVAVNENHPNAVCW